MFITGFDAALDALEERLENLKLGEKFDFELEKEQAFGEYEPKRVIDLNKEMFTVDGQFDSKNIFKGAQIPLKNEDGNFFIGTVLEIGDASVKSTSTIRLLVRSSTSRATSSRTARLQWTRLRLCSAT